MPIFARAIHAVCFTENVLSPPTVIRISNIRRNTIPIPMSTSGGEAEAEAWRKNADTHKLRPEDLKKYGVEESKRRPGSGGAGEVLHQRRSLPMSPVAMAVGGFVLISGVIYFTLYAKPKTGVSPNQVATAGRVEPPDAPRRPAK